MSYSDIYFELQEELDSFKGRKEDLKNIPRYHRYKHMLYRLDLFSHAKHVAWIVADVSPRTGDILKGYDCKRAVALALVHDDAEIITGDFQSANRVLMTEKQILSLDNAEEEAIQVLAERFPKTIGGFTYTDLLHDVLHIESVEAQVMKYLDKFEGYAEAMHEIYGGNGTFLERPATEYGAPPNAFEYYDDYFTNYIDTKLPITQRLIADGTPFFDLRFKDDWSTEVLSGTRHTLSTLFKRTDYHHYDNWMRVMIESGDSEEIEKLYTISPVMDL